MARVGSITAHVYGIPKRLGKAAAYHQADEWLTEAQFAAETCDPEDALLYFIEATVLMDKIAAKLDMGLYSGPQWDRWKSVGLQVMELLVAEDG